MATRPPYFGLKPGQKPRYLYSQPLTNFNLQAHADALVKAGNIRGKVVLSGDTAGRHPSAFASFKKLEGRDADLIGSMEHGGPANATGRYTVYFYRERRMPKKPV